MSNAAGTAEDAGLAASQQAVCAQTSRSEAPQVHRELGSLMQRSCFCMLLDCAQLLLCCCFVRVMYHKIWSSRYSSERVHIFKSVGKHSFTGGGCSLCSADSSMTAIYAMPRSESPRNFEWHVVIACDGLNASVYSLANIMLCPVLGNGGLFWCESLPADVISTFSWVLSEDQMI